MGQESAVAQVEALRGSLKKEKEAEVAQVRAELLAKHQEEMEGMKASLVKAEGARDDTEQLEQRNKELAQQTAKCSALEEQVAKLSRQLQDEETSKKVRTECETVAENNDNCISI